MRFASLVWFARVVAGRQTAAGVLFANRVAERTRILPSSSTAWATSTRSRAQIVGDGASANRAITRSHAANASSTGSSPARELVRALRAAFEATRCRARCRIRSPGSSTPRNAAREHTRSCPSSGPTASSRRVTSSAAQSRRAVARADHEQHDVSGMRFAAARRRRRA